MKDHLRNPEKVKCSDFVKTVKIVESQADFDAVINGVGVKWLTL